MFGLLNPRCKNAKPKTELGGVPHQPMGDAVTFIEDVDGGEYRDSVVFRGLFGADENRYTEGVFVCKPNEVVFGLPAEPHGINSQVFFGIDFTQGVDIVRGSAAYRAPRSEKIEHCLFSVGVIQRDLIPIEVGQYKRGSLLARFSHVTGLPRLDSEKDRK